MEGLNFIKQEALKRGACNSIKSIKTLEGIIKLLFSSQGREFCQRTYYPSLDHLREFKNVYNELPGVYIDAGEVASTDILSLVAGNSTLNLKCATPTYLFKTIVMHGAYVKIQATNYAVVLVTNIGGHVEVDADDTCIISIEEEK